MEDDTNSLSENDPYREIEENTRAGLRPSLPGDDAQKNASAAEKLRGAEEASASINDSSDDTTYINSVTGRDSEDSDNESHSSVPFAAKLPMIICGIALAAMPLIFSALATLYPFHLAANGVGKIVQFGINVKKKVVAVFTGEYLEAGDVPAELTGTLKEVGIECGVEIEEENGETSFIETNHIIAHSGSDYIIAATDGSEFHVKAPATGSGGLKIRYKGEIYDSKTFVAALDSDDELYLAVDSALGGDSIFFYDRSGENTFSELGINRDPYHDYESKAKQIEENPTQEQKAKLDSGLTAERIAFEELFADAIDYDPSNTSTVSGGSNDQEEDDEESEAGEEEGDADFESAFDGENDDGGEEISDSGYQSEEDLETARKLAEKFIDIIAKGTKTNGWGASAKEEATKKAAAVLNAIVSANEPYQSARASSAILIAAEQAKAGYGGPINEMSDYMMTDYASLEDEVSGSEDANKSSANESDNLKTIVTGGDFYAEAAKPYSRDRISSKSDVGDKGKEVNVSILSGFKKFLNWVVGLLGGTTSADAEALKNQYSTDIAKAVYMKASLKMKGNELGERITEGLSFLNTNLSKNAGAANASDQAAVTAYNSYSKKLYDRHVAAERATKSPFDLTSPNTFFGSIVNSVYSLGVSESSTFGKLTKLGSLASKSFGKLFLGAYADSESSTYMGNYGDCPTVGGIGATGDIYCNQFTTYDVTDFSEGGNIITAKMSDYAEGGKYYNKLSSNFKTNLKYSLSGDSITGGEINSKSDMAAYTILSVDRNSTPGVLDASACESLKKGILGDSVAGYVYGALSSVVASCDGIKENDATGYTFGNISTNSDWNSSYKYIQGYYLEVYARELTGYYKEGGRVNPILAFKEEYYKNNPKDNSYEGVLARRTGWSKEDIIAGLEAERFIAYLNGYDPSTRLSFVEPVEPVEIVFENNTTPTDTRLADNNKKVFGEKRNRIVVLG